MSKALTTTSPQNDPDWVEIVEKIFNELDAEDLPEPVIRSLEYLLSGYSIPETAREVGVRPETIRSWIKRYPTINLALARGKPLLSRWRLNQLDRQFLMAIKKSEDILSIDLHSPGVDPKILSALGNHVRHILGMIQGAKIDVTVTHEMGETVLSARQEALDYLSQKMAQMVQEQDPPIETIVRVINPDQSPPFLDAQGNPNYGELGKLDTNESGACCHICGKRYKNLAAHVYRHQVTVEEYETTYLLPPGSLNSEQYE